MNRKQKITISITGIVLILLILIGLTYAYYLTTINSNTNEKSVTVSLAKLELKYDDGNGLISKENMMPGDKVVKTFSVENKGNREVENYTVYLENIINEFEDKNDLYLNLKCSSTEGDCNGNNLIYPSSDGVIAVNNIKVGEIQSFELTVEFLETNDLQNDNMNKKFEGNVKILDIRSAKGEVVKNEESESIFVDNAKAIKNFKIYGNSLQNISTQSSNLCSSFKYGKWELTNGAYVDDDGNLTLPDLTSKADIKIPWNKRSDSVNVSYLLVSGGNAHINITYKDENGKKLSGNGSALKDKEDNYQVRVTFGGNNDYGVAIQNSSYLILSFQRSTAYAANEYKVKNIMVSADSVKYDEFIPDSPSPEYPSEIQSVGDLVTDTSDVNNGKYKIELKTTGKNLMNVDEMLSYSNDVIKNGNKYTFNTRANMYTKGIKMNLKKGTTIISSGKVTNITGKNFRVDAVFKNGKSQMITNYSKTDLNTEVEIGKMTTLDDDVEYIRFNWTTDGKYIIKDFQIEIGETASEYEPYHEKITNIYLDEPLRKIGEYSDYIDLINKKVVRNVGKYIFNGTEDFDGQNGEYNTENRIMFSRTISSIDELMINRKVISNYFKQSEKSVQSKVNDITGINFNTMEKYSKVMYFKLPKSLLETLDAAGMQKWIKELYDSGNPLIINYQITNKEENIDFDNLDIINNTSNITINTNTKISRVDLEYLK